jgi:multidrug efflux pump subunit AcrA (membrane-fusion protein)
MTERLVHKSVARLCLLLVPLILVAVAGRDAGYALAADSGPAQIVQVTVVRVRNACFSAAIRVTGFLVARQEAIVPLDAPGAKVTEVLAAEGDRVTAGQALARLTRPILEGPEAGKTVTVTLKAPAAGLVTRSTAVVGITTNPLQPEPLFRIAIDGEIELEAEVPSIHVPLLAPGQNARAEIENNQLGGRVRLAPAAIDERTQLGRARLSLERDSSLKLGMFARATIDANRSCGLSIPRSALFYRTDGPSVQIVRDDTIETRLVQTGFHSDTDTEIREGLREGDLVVANAGSSLRDGDKVKPVFAEVTGLGQP